MRFVPAVAPIIASGLDDAVLIKDNHIALAGGLRTAVERVKANIGHLVKIEVEVDTLPQLEEALTSGVDAVLLDNMTAEQLTRACGDGRSPRGHRGFGPHHRCNRAGNCGDRC